MLGIKLDARPFLDRVAKEIGRIDADEVKALADAIYRCYEKRRFVFVIGNGGSASTASHMMNDLCKFTRSENHHRIRAIAFEVRALFKNSCSNRDSGSQPPACSRPLRRYAAIRAGAAPRAVAVSRESLRPVRSKWLSPSE